MERQTTFAEPEGVGKDSNPRYIAYNNWTLLPASMNERYIHIRFLFEIC